LFYLDTLGTYWTEVWEPIIDEKIDTLEKHIYVWKDKFIDPS